MPKLAVTPCCGTIAEPRSKIERARRRTLLRLGTCPLCKLDLTSAISPMDEGPETTRAKLWFHCNAYKSGKAGSTWEWSDDECVIWRDLPESVKAEIEPNLDRWVRLNQWTGTLVIKMNTTQHASDIETILMLKKFSAEHLGQGKWQVWPTGNIDILIRFLERQEYTILPSAKFAARYEARYML